MGGENNSFPWHCNDMYDCIYTILHACTCVCVCVFVCMYIRILHLPGCHLVLDAAFKKRKTKKKKRQGFVLLSDDMGEANIYNYLCYDQGGM